MKTSLEQTNDGSFEAPLVQSRPVYRFGDFMLHAAERRLEQDGAIVRIGARAFDILSLLVERAGQAVSKREISDRVWPDVTVGESSLRFQMVSLRKLIGDNGDEGSIIATLPGRGYSFVAPVQAVSAAPGWTAAVHQPGTPLPARQSRMVGRASELASVLEALLAHRFVTLVGPGGIGKTTLAVAAAHAAADTFAGQVHFVDLSSISDPMQVSKMLAVSMGLPLNADDPRPAIITRLNQRPTLLILDSCEHLVESVAELAEMIFVAAPQLTILATSREALRVVGERTLPLEPLPYPAASEPFRTSDLADYAAIELFVERTNAAGSPLVVDDETGPLIVEICRQVDGIALALEIAAGRVPSYGLRGTVALLEDRFQFLTGGRRTAVPRHRALADTIAWSYDLLEPDAKTAFHRLSVLVGDFDLDAAVAMTIGPDLGRARAIDAVGSLASKSLVSVRRTALGVRYRLLDTTRAYALEQLTRCGERDQTAQRHARYFASLLSTAGGEQLIGAFAPNLRVALEWCFGAGDDHPTGVHLAVGACPLLLARSLLTDCVHFSRAALGAMSDGDRESRGAMVLLSCLGQSLMFSAGNTPEAEQALSSALRLAEHFQEDVRCLKLSGALHIFHERTGDYLKALDFAERGLTIANQIGDEAAIAAGHSLLGISHHLMGDNAKTDVHLRIALDVDADAQAIDPTGFGFNHRNRARITMARSHFLQGRPVTADAVARQAVAEALNLGHPVTYAIALIWSAEIAGWRRDWDAVEDLAERLLRHSERNSLRPYPAISKSARGLIAVHAGRPEEGYRMLAEASDEMSAVRYELVNSVTGYQMADALLRMGKAEAALEAIQRCEARIDAQGDRLHRPEVLRIKGEILSSFRDRAEAADAAFGEAIACASAQNAAFWELRATLSLARHRSGDASALHRVQIAYGKYGELLAIPDLLEARRVLATPDLPLA